MASSSSSAPASFGLGRKKKSPTLMDQIGNFFGGDKKRKGKGSFRGAVSPSPQKATAPKKKGQESAVGAFFRSIGSQKSAKGKKAGQGSLNKIFKVGSRSGSPAKR